MSVELERLELHKKDSLLQYVEVRDTYASFAEAIKGILDAALADNPIHAIQARAKDFDSFSEKASKRDATTNELKYLDPLNEITDLAGVRVITYVPKTVEDVEKVIRREFDVQERLDKDAALLGSGQIGYKSIHFLVQLKNDRSHATEYSRFDSLIAEIQIRTILQHAWAEMEHDIQYKSDQQIPNELKRRFVALAGLLEIADREFESIQIVDERLRSELRTEIKEELSQLAASNVDHADTLMTEAPYSSAAIKPSPPDDPIQLALRRYDELIASEPGQYAHFVGRAKAKFLLGDRSGALGDLEVAESLSPGNSQVATVRQRIEDGRIHGKTSYSTAQQHTVHGHHCLETGKISEAASSYSKAEKLGLAKIQSSFNLAICACLEGNIPEMETQLNSVTPHKGSFIEINHLALRTLAYKLNDEQGHDLVAMDETLKDLISKNGSYELQQSPLRFLICTPRLLEQGQELQKIQSTLDILNKTLST